MRTKQVVRISGTAVILLALTSLVVADRQLQQRLTRERHQQEALEALAGAVRVGDEGTARRLLTATNSTPKLDANTVAPETKRTLLTLAIETEQPRMVKLLLEHGADPNLRDQEGRTPLTLSVRRGSLSLAQALLASGARLDSVDQDGANPVAMAARADASTPMLRFLLSRVTDPKDKREKAKIILQIATASDNPSAIQLARGILQIKTPLLSPINHHRYQLVPFNGPLQVKRLADGNFALRSGGRTLATFTSLMEEMDRPSQLPLSSGYVFALSQRRLLRHGAYLADFTFAHNLRDYSHWDSRGAANEIRYHFGLGGVKVGVEGLHRESASSTLALLAWTAKGPSQYTGLARQLIRLQSQPQPSMEVLANLDDGGGEGYGRGNPFFVWNGLLLVRSGGQLHQVVRSGKPSP